MEPPFNYESENKKGDRELWEAKTTLPDKKYPDIEEQINLSSGTTKLH